jgi:hypothetical protein
MRKSILAACILFAAFAVPVISFAQDQDKAAESATPVHFYRLTLTVQEVDSSNKPINSRSYATTVSTDSKNPFSNSIRTSSRLPVATGTFSSGEKASTQNVQFTYIDIGANFDIKDVKELGRQLSLHVKADISSNGGNTPMGNSANFEEPIIRHNQWESPVLITIGKPTVIFSSDALESKNAMQVVATVIPIP